MSTWFVLFQDSEAEIIGSSTDGGSIVKLQACNGSLHISMVDIVRRSGHPKSGHNTHLGVKIGNRCDGSCSGKLRDINSGFHFPQL